jgi:anti-anti-sigma factor
MIAISGRLNTERIKLLEKDFYPLFKAVESGSKLFLNLYSVKVIDSRGISFIVGLYKECLLKNISLNILASKEVYSIIHQIRLDRMIPVQEIV